MYYMYYCCLPFLFSSLCLFIYVSMYLFIIYLSIIYLYIYLSVYLSLVCAKHFLIATLSSHHIEFFIVLVAFPKNSVTYKVKFSLFLCHGYIASCFTTTSKLFMFVLDQIYEPVLKQLALYLKFGIHFTYVMKKKKCPTFVGL